MNGRELSTYSDGTNNISYKYNLNGIRTSKIVNGIKTNYILEGTSIIFEDRNGDVIYYIYNGDEILGFIYNSKTYYYHKNMFGDIIGILDSNYNEIVTYEYDSWGALVNITDNSIINLGTINPFRYRSYYYDTETGLYYLNSRYYNPQIGRFINADGIISKGNVLANNLFSYVYNNFINSNDTNGNRPGDLFNTMDEAARDAAIYMGEISFNNKWEYSAAIYSIEVTTIKFKRIRKSFKFLWYRFTINLVMPYLKKETKYSYTEIETIQDKFNSWVPDVYNGSQVASIHTHPYEPGFGLDSASSGDRLYAKRRNEPLYIYGPNGCLSKYYPKTDKEIRIFNDLPRDPNYPNK